MLENLRAIRKKPAKFRAENATDASVWPNGKLPASALLHGEFNNKWKKMAASRLDFSSAQALPHHAAAQVGDLGLQRQLFRADIVAAEQAHAAEHAAVVANQIEEIGV